MTKPTLTLLFILCSAISIKTFAQIEKGTSLISLSGAYTKQKSNQSTNPSSYNLDVSGIRMLSQHFGLGFGIGLNGTKGPYLDPFVPTSQIVTLKTYNFTIGPIARYYFMPSKTISPFLSSQVGVYTGQIDNNGNVYKSDGLKVGYDFAVGLAFLLNKNVAFETALHYKRTNSINTTGGTNYWVLGFGFQVFLPKK